jgi:hypothetical protein
MGRIHSVAGEAGRLDSPACEIGAVAGLTRRKAIRLCFYRCAVLSRRAPARGMAWCCMAESIVKATGSRPGRCGRRRRQRRVRAVRMALRAEGGIPLIRIRMGPCTASPGSSRMGSIDPVAGETG